MKKIILTIIIIIGFKGFINAQGGIPIYHDYLSDNLYLLHPSMAGASSCAKVRLTGRMQWFDIQDNPMLQTFSYHTHLGENASNGVGVIIFNDRNGYHSQKGLQLAYAHHLDFGNGGYVNKLSFGIAGSFVQNQLDETTFDPNRVDPIISGVVQSAMYYNMDFGLSYHVRGFFFNATLKNALFAARDLYTPLEPVNLRNYVGSIGYYIGDSNNTVHVEPSAMVQYKEFSGQVITDANLKVYFAMGTYNTFYMGASYRKDWDDQVNQQIYHSITPILGFNINKFTFAYTYTYDLGDTPISTSGFHQLTLGYNFNCRRQLVRMGCPEIF